MEESKVNKHNKMVNFTGNQPPNKQMDEAVWATPAKSGRTNLATTIGEKYPLNWNIKEGSTIIQCFYLQA